MSRVGIQLRESELKFYSLPTVSDPICFLFCVGQERCWAFDDPARLCALRVWQGPGRVHLGQGGQPALCLVRWCQATWPGSPQRAGLGGEADALTHSQSQPAPPCPLPTCLPVAPSEGRKENVQEATQDGPFSLVALGLCGQVRCSGADLHFPLLCVFHQLLVVILIELDHAFSS